jgi:hypothetical protein
MIANSSAKNIGATNANSIAAEPRLLRPNRRNNLELTGEPPKTDILILGAALLEPHDNPN